LKTKVRIGLVGDYDATVLAHQAIPRALGLAADALGLALLPEWVPTDEVKADSHIARFDGLWCVPATPYRSAEGALRAIRFARRQARPFLGTCGGFQHAIIEFAREVLGWTNADHAETAPHASHLVIAPLACALVEVTGKIFFRVGSRVAQAYGSLEASEGYHCRYGINPEYQKTLFSGTLRMSGEDAAGEVRAVELDDHPFFVATLFQPERAALADRLPPLVAAFVKAAAEVQDNKKERVPK